MKDSFESTPIMQPTCNIPHTAKRHFGIIYQGDQVEVMLTENDLIVEVRNGAWVVQRPAEGLTPEQCFNSARARSLHLGDVVDFT